MITWIKKKLGVTNSELFAYSTLVIWAITVAMSFISFLLWDKNTGFILISVSSTFGVSLTAYMAKANSENKSKYAKVNDAKNFIEETYENYKKVE